MNCPYCNKKLKHFVASAYGYWCGCDKTDGMIGTLAMWEKVAQIVKIRNAGKRYIAKNSQTEEYKKRKRETSLRWYHKHKSQQKKENA